MNIIFAGKASVTFVVIMIAAIAVSILLSVVFSIGCRNLGKVSSSVGPNEIRQNGDYVLDPNSSLAFSKIKVNSDTVELSVLPNVNYVKFAVIEFKSAKKKSLKTYVAKDKGSQTILVKNNCKALKIVVLKVNNEAVKKSGVKTFSFFYSLIEGVLIAIVCAVLIIFLGQFVLKICYASGKYPNYAMLYSHIKFACISLAFIPLHILVNYFLSK